MVELFLNPKEHRHRNYKYKNTPYEKYHLTEEEHVKIMCLTTEALDGFK